MGPYEILVALGAGGMGEVYKARDTRLDRTVAIKVLPAHVASDPDVRHRFEREARAVAALNHPHICTLHDVGNQDGTDFLVMEYLEGETLADRFTKSGLPLDQALRYGIEIADALDRAHRAGIVHRDLKPGNIMLTKGGAKLLDFGLAKTGAAAVAGTGLSMLPTTPLNLTAQGTILGTFQYMAPEQLKGQEADTRTDIFAFGAVLYEMLTGKKDGAKAKPPQRKSDVTIKRWSAIGAGKATSCRASGVSVSSPLRDLSGPTPRARSALCSRPNSPRRRVLTPTSLRPSTGGRGFPVSAVWRYAANLRGRRTVSEAGRR